MLAHQLGTIGQQSIRFDQQLVTNGPGPSGTRVPAACGLHRETDGSRNASPNHRPAELAALIKQAIARRPGSRAAL
jgi:hypothetical protein